MTSSAPTEAPGAAALQASVITPYVPRLLIQRLAHRPGLLVEEVEGTVVFVDISGFTKLSERLARKGKLGAEELTESIESCFTGLLALAYANGGSLIKFGGDALLLFFTGDEHAARGCRSAVWMRRTLREIGKLETSGGKVTLRMSVGVHSGWFHFFLVGGSHREFMITGPAASQTVLMESTAEAGEIVVSHATAAALPDRLLGAEKGPGRLLKRLPEGQVENPSEPEVNSDAEALLRCIPIAIREHLLAGVHDPEHRQAAVAFLHFDGIDELLRAQGSATAAEALDELVRDVQAEVDAHELCFLGTDVDQDGGKIILTAGVPRASGNDEEHMLLAVREIASRERTLPLRIGVNRGAVFAGDIGPPYRRTFTVMGDTVNLAARLMASAPVGAILATLDVLDRSDTEFRTVACEPFFVKGKSKPVEAFAVGEALGARTRMELGSTPFIGREAEMRSLRGALGWVREGEGRLVEIVGEPGIGKSRLLEELWAEADDLVLLALRCELYRATTPYQPFRELLEHLLGIENQADEGRTLARLRELVATNKPELMPWIPLLAVPLDVELPQTPETEALDERFRRARLEAVLGELLAALLPTPTLITIEDAHWMDEASADLLRHLIGLLEGAPWLICLTRRPVSTGFEAPEDARVVTLRPAPLDASAAVSLLDVASEESPLPPQQIEALASRSGGNPLLLRELLAAAQAAGGIDELPDSVEALMTARIDRLTPGDRALLRRASVLGNAFPAELLAEVRGDDEVRIEEDVWGRLGEFLQRQSDDTFAFRHALVRDAAYAGLPYRLRRDLHARVAEVIERKAEDPDEEAELLSLHYFHARRLEEAWHYSRIAGDRARAKYAPVEAAEFYRRAVDAGRDSNFTEPSQVSTLLEALGDVQERAGSYSQAAQAFGTARKLAAGDRVRESQLYLKRAYVSVRASSHSQALRWIGKGYRALEGVGGNEAARGRAQLAVWHAAVKQEQGRQADAIQLCYRAIEEAELAGDMDALAHSYYILDWALADLGRLEEAVHSQRALEIYRELGDVSSQAAVLQNLGGFAYFKGDWDEAVRLYERGREARERTGDPVNAAAGTFNIGEILSDQGHLTDAERSLREALRIWKAAGDQIGVAFAVSFLGRVASRGGLFDQAAELLREARSRFQEAGAMRELIEVDAYAAELLVFRGMWHEALEAADVALKRSNPGIGVGAQDPLLHRVRGVALIQGGDLVAGRAALERSLSSARSRGAPYEAALTQRAQDRLDLPSDSDGGRGEAPSSVSILRGLGVVAVFDPALTPAPGQAVDISPEGSVT